jgi:RNA polymerase sigma factor (sigma-70 family)
MTEAGGDVPDFELVRRMADEPRNPVTAREAWGVFYVRHRRFLSRVFISAFGSAGDSASLEDAVHDTFMKAFHGAATFDCDVAIEPVLQSRKVRSWLARISENVLRDRFRDRPDVEMLDEGEMERLGSGTEPAEESDELPECERLKLLKSGIALLSDVEQTILLATSFWLRPGERHQRMPHEAMAELSRNTGKSPDNIRQIRLRAVRKLEKFINDHLGQ